MEGEEGERWAEKGGFGGVGRLMGFWEGSMEWTVKLGGSFGIKYTSRP